jgi:hypothetical protein
VRLYLFENVENLSNREHPSGGLIVVANDKDHARQLIAASEKQPYHWTEKEKQGPIEVSDEEWLAVLTYPIDGRAEPRLFAFPDAGCC